MKPLRPLAGCLGVLAVANVLNNRVARRMAPVTSAAALTAMLVIVRRHGVTWPELGFLRSRRGAALGGALAAAVAAGYAAGVAIPHTRAFFHDQRALGLSRARLLEEALVQVPVGTVLLEEIGFRGVLPALLGRVLPGPTAAAASAALFGLWHVLPAVDMAKANPALGRLAGGSAGADGPAGADAGDGRARTARLVAGTVVTTAAAGVLFHELRRRGGLLAPALLHLATNSLGYLAAHLSAQVRRPA